VAVCKKCGGEGKDTCIATARCPTGGWAICWAAIFFVLCKINGAMGLTGAQRSECNDEGNNCGGKPQGDDGDLQWRSCGWLTPTVVGLPERVNVWVSAV
jgi:hypothetical protein